jgi:ABC-2 type transport system permease protein
MRTIIFLIRKEFRQIRRNKTILPIIFVLPIIQLLILVHATTFEIKHANICLVDYDQSGSSQRLIHELEGSSFFNISELTFSIDEAYDLIAENKSDIIMVIPSEFGRNLVKEKKTTIQFIPNAINSNFATLTYSYATQVVRKFNQDIVFELMDNIQPNTLKSIDARSQFWYNPELNYKWYMFPGIMVILISMVGIFLSGLNVVREKEIGTSEQLNVTPIKKYQFIIGKLMPFLFIGIFELVLALLLGRIVYGVPLVGSFWVLLGFTTLYLFVVLGLGLFISTMAETQQQMMFVAFFVVIVFILLSGIFTPLESMPVFVQKIDVVNPFMWFMRVIRMVMLKGSCFRELHTEFMALLIYAVTILSLATWRYRKTA